MNKQIEPIRPEDLPNPELSELQQDMIEILNYVLKKIYEGKISMNNSHVVILSPTKNDLIRKLEQKGYSKNELLGPKNRYVRNIHVVKNYFRKYGWRVEYKNESLEFTPAGYNKKIT